MKQELSIVSVMILIVCVELFSTTASLSPHDKPCWKSAGTQMELNQCAGEELEAANAELQKSYERLLSKYAYDQQRGVRIRKAQQAWLAFRQAEVEALFPESETDKGSVWPMCRLSELANITHRRVEELNAMLDAQEGDVCHD